MKNINTIYLSQFFSGFAMFASLTPLYFLSQGITQSQLGILIAANILTLAIFDIPTGAIADTIGHKTSVFLGTFIWSLSYLILFFAKGFPLFLLSMIIGGMGIAFVSGAFTSLVYDILDKLGKRDSFRKVYGRCNAIFLIASMIAASVGGFVYQYQPTLIFLASFIFTLLGAITVLFVSWNFTGKTPSASSYFNKMKNGVTLTITNKSLLSLVMISIGLSFGVFVINNIKQPLLIRMGYDVAQIGIITGIISGVSAFLYTFGDKIIKKVGNFPTLIFMSLIAILSLVLLSFSGPMITIIFLIIYQLTPALRDPAIVHLQQLQIADEQRATANSTMSFLTRIVISLCLPLWGILIDKVGINSSLVYLAVVTSIITVSGFLSYRRYGS